MVKEDRGFSGVGYLSSQRALIKASGYILAVAAMLALIGALLR